MATVRKRNLLSSRRRLDDEGEDDEAATIGVDDDSQSEPSIPSDNDADDSELSEPNGAEGTDATAAQSKSDSKTSNTQKRRRKKKGEEHKTNVTKATSEGEQKSKEQKFVQTADTDVMMNGFDNAASDVIGDSIQFQDAISESRPAPGTSTTISGTTQDHGVTSSSTEQKAIELSNERAKREFDPAVIPNRGGFFMHDQRNLPRHQQSYGFARGRGRGRGTQAGGYGYLNGMTQPSDGRWDHDLHDTVIDSKPIETVKPSIPRNEPPPKAAMPLLPQQLPNALSRSVPIGTISARILLPGMGKAITFEKMPVKQHTRLPDLRPPLRRDKPVRIAIPDHLPRYIFPSPDRSFIFIPRAQRPNQQSGRGRGRGYYSQYNSRRNSMYGGSVYSPSVAMSRRSSQAPDGVISPTGSAISRPPQGAPTGPARPVVKLPIAQYHYDGSGPSMQMSRAYSSGGPSASNPVQGYPLPSQAVHENVANSIPMHQPRPQKTVSVASIESPGPVSFHAPQQQEQQPFHHQVPPQSNGQATHQDQQHNFSHSRQMSFHSQPTAGTPLSHIPERAINAQPFQPMAVPQQSYYANYPMYYYPSSNGQQPQFNPAASMTPNVYMPGPQQSGYLIPLVLPQQPQPAPPPQQQQGQQLSENESVQQQQLPGMYAHESNGMVYYYNPTQFMPAGDGMSPVPYSVPAPGSVMTPGQEGYYYPHQGMVFYGPQG